MTKGYTLCHGGQCLNIRALGLARYMQCTRSKRYAMFSLISYKLTVQGKAYQLHQIHMTFETDIALRNLRSDSRVSDIQNPIQFETLEAAQVKQKELRAI